MKMGVKTTSFVLFVILFIVKLSYAEEKINFSKEDNQEPHNDAKNDGIEGRWGYHRRPSYGQHHHHSNSISSSTASSYNYQHHSGTIGSHHHGPSYLPVPILGNGHGNHGSQRPIGYPISSGHGGGYELQVQHRPGYGSTAGVYGNHRPISTHALEGVDAIGHYGQLSSHSDGQEVSGLKGQQNILKGPGGYDGIAQDHYIKEKDSVLHGQQIPHQGLVPVSPIPYPPGGYDTPKIQFTSLGPNGRPAVSYTSKNFGFYFRNRNAAEDTAKAEKEEADSSAVQY